MESQDFAQSDPSTTQSNGIAVFISNIPHDVTKAVLKVRGQTCGPRLHLSSWFCWCCKLTTVICSYCRQFVTADRSLSQQSQAELTLTAVAYQSPNQRYIYIEPLMPNRALQVGSHANIKVYFAMPSYVPTSALSYVVRERRLFGLAVPTGPIFTVARNVAPPLRCCPKVRWCTLGLKSFYRVVTTCKA